MVDINSLFKSQTDEYFSDFIQHLHLELDIVNGPWICGGTARRLWQGEPWENHDIDLFFPNQDSFNRTLLLLWPHQGGHETHKTTNATTYNIQFNDKNYKVQCICKEYYKTVYDLWQSFDFTVCCFATDGKLIMADINAAKDVNTKTMSYVPGSTRPIDGRRVTKYGIYGFNPTKHILTELRKDHRNQTLTAKWSSTDDYT